METKLYVGNFSGEMTEQELRAIFNEAGTVVFVELIMDRQTRKPKGFAFITLSNQAEADKAIHLFNAKFLNDRALKVTLAKRR